jgi:DNA invertase Pin-like site-specific DNA recombinase
MRDKKERGRSAGIHLGVQTTPKLTEEQVGEMRELRARGLTLREIAERYGVSISTTCNIVNRKTWKGC